MWHVHKRIGRSEAVGGAGCALLSAALITTWERNLASTLPLAAVALRPPQIVGSVMRFVIPAWHCPLVEGVRCWRCLDCLRVNGAVVCTVLYAVL